ncbi:MAG TPA: hypothetical protein VIM11_04980, partial [Tepidisphaeraceae bacterium]
MKARNPTENICTVTRVFNPCERDFSNYKLYESNYSYFSLRQHGLQTQYRSTLDHDAVSELLFRLRVIIMFLPFPGPLADLHSDDARV